MGTLHPKPTGREATFRNDDVIVSKTDLRGKITYVNDVFVAVSGYTPPDLLGQPHSMIRHPDMPRCVFEVLWRTIASGREVFAYVMNLARDGSHYWVLAHVTPSHDQGGRHVGYHSHRRAPWPDALAKVKPLYGRLLGIERSHEDRARGLAESTRAVEKLLEEHGMEWNEFVFGLSKETRVDAAVA